MRNESVNKLLVRAPNWIGDAVMCEPALRSLRALFPSAEIVLLAKPLTADLFRSYPGIDRTLLYQDKQAHAGLSGKWALAGTLRRDRFDLAVLFQNAFEAAFIAWLAGIPRRYGYTTDGRVLFLTDPVAVPAPASLRHQVRYYWDLLKPLGLAGEPSAPSLTILPEEEQAMAVRLHEAGMEPADVLIGINPGSTYGGAKRWLPERFAETAERLSADIERDRGRSVTIAIVGGKGEEELGYAVAERLTRRTVVLSGRTTVRELMAVTKRCDLLLTNDTGPMHIAAAFGVPLVAVFGPTDWRTTSPYEQEQSLIRQPVECAPCLLRECPIDHRCMTRVSVDQVYETAVKQLVYRRQPSTISREPSMAAHHASPIASPGNARSATGSVESNLGPVEGHHSPLQGVTVFLDRDGTLNPDPGYIRSPEQFELFPGAAQALARLKTAGARLIVVTNQSGIARGVFSHGDLETVHAKLRKELTEAGASLDAIYYCPHHPDEGCACRKPRTGLIDQALADWPVDLGRSYLVGDQVRDMELAQRLGIKEILVMTGSGGRDAVAELALRGLKPDFLADGLSEAVEWILQDVRRRRAGEESAASTPSSDREPA